MIARWEEIKAEERAGGPKTLLSGIPSALPSLLRADQIGRRAATVGFDWAAAGDVIDKMREEVDELCEVVSAGATTDRVRAEEEMGDLLFAIASLSRKLDIEPESALRKANDKFTRRFTAMEARIVQSGRKIRELTLDELEAEWQQVKMAQTTDE